MQVLFLQQVQLSLPRLRALVIARLGADSDVEDVVQRIVVRAWRGYTGLRDVAAFPAWLSQIAANEITDVQRRRHVREVELTEAYDWAESDFAFDGPDREQMSTCVQELASELPEAQRSVVVLHHGYGLTHSDVARGLGCSQSAAKIRAYRGRVRLAELVEQRCELEQNTRGVLVCTPRSVPET